MTPTQKAWAIIGGVVLGVAAVGGVAYAATRPKPQSLTGFNQIVLQPGHRYQLTVTDPAIAQLPSSGALTVQNAQNAFNVGMGQGSFVVVSAAVAGPTWTLVFDYKGSGPMSLNSADFAFSPTTTTASITDLGRTPS